MIMPISLSFFVTSLHLAYKANDKIVQNTMTCEVTLFDLVLKHPISHCCQTDSLEQAFFSTVDR